MLGPPAVNRNDLETHLEERYGVRIAGVEALDVGVFRVDHVDDSSWVARVFPAQRRPEHVEGDAAILCHDLPHAFVHPDFVPANAIPTPDEHLVIVDWTGAGRGPRLWSLAFLLWAAGARSLRLVDVAVSRYRKHVTLEPDELTRLAGAIRARPLTLECWAFCAGRRELADAVERVSAATELADTIAARARQAFETS
jgi:Ser/Thr protein kinase RdoA (MazF antagonist)